VVLLLDTGFRLGEAMSSGASRIKRKRWVDQKGRWHEGTWLALPKGTTKNGKARDVPCTKRVLSILPELNERARNGRWFPWAMGSSGPLYLLQNIREDMKEKGFDIDDIVLHTFRHTCASRLADNGMDLVSLRDWLGHSDIKITAQRYVHRMTGHLWVGAGILDGVNGTDGEDGGNEVDDGDVFSMSDRLTSGRDRDSTATMGHC
jgi:integrase